MRDKLMKKLDKKEKLNPLEKEAKMGVIKELSRQAGSMMGDKLNGLKKVTVAGKSKGDLEKGLDTAKKLIDGKANDSDPEGILEGAEDDMGEDLDHDNEEGESPFPKGHDLSPAAAEHEGDECNTPEEVDAKIQELLLLKEKMKQHK